MQGGREGWGEGGGGGRTVRLKSSSVCVSLLGAGQCFALFVYLFSHLLRFHTRSTDGGNGSGSRGGGVDGGYCGIRGGGGSHDRVSGAGAGPRGGRVDQQGATREEGVVPPFSVCVCGRGDL